MRKLRVNPRRLAGRLSGRLVGGLFLALLLLAASLTPALAQDAGIAPLLQRLERLERDIVTLQRQVYRGRRSSAATPQGDGQFPPEFAARTELRLTGFEEQISQLTGRIEEVAFAVGGIRDRIEKTVGDLEERLALLERRAAASGDEGTPGAMGSSGPGLFGTILRAEPTENQQAKSKEGAKADKSASLLSPPSPVPPPLPVSPRKAYSDARALVFDGDYEAAEAALRDFLDAYPDHELAGNARYWLAETFYVRGDVEQAASLYAEGYEKAPSGTKAPDNLLKLGVSLRRLGRKRDACTTFEQLKHQFPDASRTIKERASREISRLGCSGSSR
jgi:tol-pal system protein YbgF